MNSKRMTYVIAGSVIGGTVGYLIFSGSGRRAVRSVRHMDVRAIPEKMEEFRNVLERRGQDLAGRLETIRKRVMDGIEAGKQSYDETSTQFRSRLGRVESRGQEVTQGVHKTVDELNRTVTSMEHSVMDPIYQVGALIRAIQRAFQTSMNRERGGKIGDVSTFESRFSGIR